MGAPRVRTRLGVFSRKSAVRFADGRTIESRIIRDLQRQLIDQLGGEDRVTPAQRLAVHAAAVLAFRLRAACERYVMAEDVESLDKHVVCVSGALTRTLVALGLQRVGDKEPISLEQYLADRKSVA